MEDSKPPIWRRLLVRSDITLGDLHRIIQAAFGWEDYHLHQFIIGEIYFGVPHPDYDDHLEMHDERKMKLHQITRRERTTEERNQPLVGTGFCRVKWRGERRGNHGVRSDR